MMQSKSLLSTLWSAALFCASAVNSAAQTDGYPSKHVTIITHVAAGSGPDVIARIVADRLAQAWGKQVTIINRQGAAGLIASQAAASAPPDGYTLYMPTVSALIISPEIQPKFPVNFEKDFTAIGMVGATPMVMAVAPSLAVNTLGELIALAKKRPGEILYAGNNRGSFPHLTGELLRSRAGIDLTFVSYPGAAGALKDIMGGNISMMIESPSALPGASEGGSIKAIAVTSKSRLPNFPNLPTVAETIPDFVAAGWFVLLAPAKTPNLVVRKINQDLNNILKQPAINERFATLGVYSRPMSSVETAEFIRAERQLWKPVIGAAGLATP
jgi:tripartite-type tricarboxylate transporter receptor subunit TctC